MNLKKITPKIHNVEQKSDEWFKLRELRLTASHGQAIGNIKTGFDSYILKKMSEYFSTGEVERYSGKDTDRGEELEPQARNMYELETGNKAEIVGFVSKGKYVGCSPDSFVNEDGLLEIKCPKDKIHYEMISKVNDLKEKGKSINQAIPSKYIWQCAFQMLVTDRDWCDLAFYNPNYEKELIIFRLTDKDVKGMIEKLIKGLEKGEKQIKKHLKNYDKKRNKAEEIFR